MYLFTLKSIFQNFEVLIRTVEETGGIMREIREHEDQVSPIPLLKQLNCHIRKPTDCIGENKGADQISTFVFATQIVQYFFNLKFQASIFCACTHRLVSHLVGNQYCWFSHVKAQLVV